MLKPKHSPNSGSELPEAGRFEFKYRISYHEYYALRNALAPHMRRDFFTEQASTRGYFVRSLYYETADNQIYAQKMSGDYSRVKYRLRSYHDQPDPALPIRAELKVRRGESLSKYQQFITLDDYTSFLCSKNWGTAPADPVLTEYARGVRLLGLQPSVLIDYHREGYEARDAGGVRLTFDHGVRSAHASSLFPEREAFFRIHHPNEVVLEIKFRNAPPRWLMPLVKRHGLRLVANSKFTQGIEAGRRDRYYPNGVLVVR